MRQISHVYKSPNFDQRLRSIDMLVIHATNMDEIPSIARLCDLASQVSCHYLINHDGEIFNLVEEQNRAWHAGVSFWRGQDQINHNSIGIELVNPNHLLAANKFSQEQMESVIELCLDLILKYNIQPYNIVAHSDIAPSRKDDPGQYFDWKLLFERGIGLCHSGTLDDQSIFLKYGDSGEKVKEVQKKLSDFGYRISLTGEFDQEMSDVVIAFKRRFYQRDLSARLDCNVLNILKQLCV